MMDLWLIRKIKDKAITIHRILYWLPIIWKDRWWDSCFLLRIIEAKLRYDADRYEKNGIGINSKEDAHNMRVAAALCKRLNEQNYTTPWDKESVKAAHGFFEYIEKHTEVIGNGLVAHTSRGYTESKNLHDASQWAAKRDSEMREQDLKYLCRILHKHLFKWWD